MAESERRRIVRRYAPQRAEIEAAEEARLQRELEDLRRRAEREQKTWAAKDALARKKRDGGDA